MDETSAEAPRRPQGDPTPERDEIIRERGIDPMPMDTAEFTRFAARERERWKAVVIQSGIKAE